MTHYCPQRHREYLKQLDKKDESSYLGWFSLGLLETLDGIIVIPKFIVAINGKVEIETKRAIRRERREMQFTNSSLETAHGRPRAALHMQSKIKSTLRHNQ